MNRIEITSVAEREIREAADWCEERSPGLGVAFVQDVGRALSAIAERPSAFPSVGRGARHFVIRRFPYGLFYRHKGDTIVVYSCFHSHRNPRELKKRL